MEFLELSGSEFFLNFLEVNLVYLYVEISQIYFPTACGWPLLIVVPF